MWNLASHVEGRT